MLRNDMIAGDRGTPGPHLSQKMQQTLGNILLGI
jgi:hypothetical protein